MKLFFRFITVAACLLAAQLLPAREGHLFATEQELAAYRADGSASLSHELFAAIRTRVLKRTQFPGLTDPTATTEWWHHVSEYMTDAAVVHLLEPDPRTDAWIRANVLALARRPIADWSGPAFRRYNGGRMRGMLETAHICWAVSVCLDLCGDLFTPEETAEIKANLREKGQEPCRYYLETQERFTNWNCVLMAGFTLASAVLEDREALDLAKNIFPTILDHYQDDGSYGETLQYGNYAAYSTMLTHEALLRSGTLKEPQFGGYARSVEWSSAAFLYRKPISGWPISMNLPRSVNFGDCAAVFRPSGDLLMHISVRGAQALPKQAGLASWLFDKVYLPVQEPAVHDMASFGFINDFGFLSVIMAAGRSAALSPEQAGLPATRAFSAGDAILRRSWDDPLVVAFRMPAEPRHDSGHLHEDANSIQLIYGGERLLVDPGHSCYRNASRKLDTGTASHNTCYFTLTDAYREKSALPEVVLRSLEVNQTICGPRILNKLKNGHYEPEPPIAFVGERLLCAQAGEVCAVGADAGAMYGKPITSFRRFVIRCGAHVVFVVDRVASEEPVRTVWNWLANNRDGGLDFRFRQPDSLYVGRGAVGLRMMHYGASAYIPVPVYGLVHDAYHPLPNQFCEGHPGSGYDFRFIENEPATERTTVHVIAVDEKGPLDGWQISGKDGRYEASHPETKQGWTLTVASNGAMTVRSAQGESHNISSGRSGWSLK
ncbi:MAG: heparinase II/III family protein [Bacteroidales bacterium]|nr:heparinase II/III family protein [Bacteroidales bacterium]